MYREKAKREAEEKAKKKEAEEKAKKEAEEKAKREEGDSMETGKQAKQQAEGATGSDNTPWWSEVPRTEVTRPLSHQSGRVTQMAAMPPNVAKWDAEMQKKIRLDAWSYYGDCAEDDALGEP